VHTHNGDSTKATNEKALNYLARKPLLNMDMLEGIRRGEAELLQVSELGVLLFHTACKTYMISTDREETAALMIASIPAADLIVAHQDFYVPQVRHKFTLSKMITVHQAAYPHGEPFPEPELPFAILPLDERHLDFVHHHYSHPAEKDYLLERLRSGVMLGAFTEGRLAGFIGMHTEGTIGMLEVLPEFRRRGIAEALEIRMINRCLAQGFTPFAQVAPDNTASLTLQRKLRFTLSEETVLWFY